MLEQDLRSPCTEEIAVFQAFSTAIREAGRTVVAMDTAPTGHTLPSLDATDSRRRAVLRRAGGNAARMTTPMMRLQGSRADENPDRHAAGDDARS